MGAVEPSGKSSGCVLGISGDSVGPGPALYSASLQIPETTAVYIYIYIYLYSL